MSVYSEVYSSTKPEKPTAKADEFASLLSTTSWYTLGVFLGAKFHELLDINRNYKDEGTLRCLIELYQCLEKKGGELLAWETIAKACRKMNEHALADRIHSEYIVQQTPAACNWGDGVVVIKADKIEEIASEYESLLMRYIDLLRDIKIAFSQVNLGEVQDLLKWRHGVPRLPPDETTVELVFDRVEEQCSLLNLRLLRVLVEKYIRNESLLTNMTGFVSAVDTFKCSANMVALVQLIQQNRQQIVTLADGHQKIVELKVRNFWNSFTAKQFEILLNELFQTLYDIMTPVIVKLGCICLNWIIPDIDTTKLLPMLPLELVRLIGVIYLHVGSDVIYNIEGEGCESIEAAMIQAIELKNTRAIELLLAVGCNPEVATYNGDNAVTNIVNIRAIESKESSSSGSSHRVDHVCILGHNQLVEAIIDPSSEPECSSCSMVKKINGQLHQEIELLTEQLSEIRHKGYAAENTLFKETNKIFIKESKEKDAEIEFLKTILAEKKSKDVQQVVEPDIHSNPLGSSNMSENQLQLENQNGYDPSVVPVWCHQELFSLHYGILPVYRTIKDFNKHKRNNAVLYTDPFYTSNGGYKVALTVYPNGRWSSEGTHVSVFVHLMKGPNDNNLQFPITGIFTMEILNWKGNNHHVVKSIEFDDDAPLECRERVTSGLDRAIGGGIYNFLSHVKLESNRARYLNGDMMSFKISFVPIIQTDYFPVPSWCDVKYATSATPPCTRTLYSYSAYKKTNSEWYSQPFYTSDKGYKLQLRVDANGEGSGKGTHLSFFVVLMKGEYDDTLSWPFNATITVQLLNWSSDNHHEEKTILHHEALIEYRQRVIEENITVRGGFGYHQFISHTKLQAYTRYPTVRFIINSNICFRIVNVEFLN